MFYDKDSMLEMFELSVGKRKWKHVLITSELFGKESHALTTKEITHMHYDWKGSIKKAIEPKDAAYVINQGNIFCLVHQDNVVTFEQKIKDILFHSANHDGGLCTSVLYLSNQETEFLLKMS